MRSQGRFFGYYLSLLLCVVSPIYLAIRVSASLPGVSVSLLHPSYYGSIDDLQSPINRPVGNAGSHTASLETPKEASTESSIPVETSLRRRGRLPEGFAHAVNSFEQYPYFAERNLQHKYSKYVKQLPAKRALSNKLGYPQHFEAARKGIEVNSRLLDQIAETARRDYQAGSALLEDQGTADFSLVTGLLAHFSRDWSDYGAKEREAVFPPILDALLQHFGSAKGNKVLVPGSGMGRLASDIADLGFYVTANEMDYGAILAYRMLSNPNLTSEPNQYTLQPFVNDWALQRNPSSRYAPVAVPDHLPNPAVKLAEGDFLEAFPEDEGQFDAVVTLFFIDMADNIIDFLSNIHRLLRPGGVWINLGPLKWGSYADLQLSAEEVLHLAELLGFDVNHESRKNIETLYGSQLDTLLKFTYVAEFWTATKV